MAAIPKHEKERQMASDRAERFMNALQESEKSGDVGPLVEQFSSDSVLSRLSQVEEWNGTEGAREFWEEYLSAFDEIRSNFLNVVEQDNSVVLEWESEGRLPNGHPLAYRGVSILEFQDDRVRHFRTYYDSAAFVLAEAR
jgi:ketosteroid isomerase-like protein